MADELPVLDAPYPRIADAFRACDNEIDLVATYHRFSVEISELKKSDPPTHMALRGAYKFYRDDIRRKSGHPKFG